MKRFVLLIVVFIMSIALIACDDFDDAETASIDEVEEKNGDDATENEEKDVNAEEDEDKADENVNLGIGDTAEFNQLKFTLKDVTTTDERNEFADEDPNVVIKIEYEIENTGDDDYPYGTDITVYDADGNQMDSYPLESDLGSLAPGKKVQGVEHHGVEATGKIEIHFVPFFSFEDTAVFEVDIE